MCTFSFVIQLFATARDNLFLQKPSPAAAWYETAAGYEAAWTARLRWLRMRRTINCIYVHIQLY